MENERNLRVKFWGVRGSIPTPATENLGYGGNTTCVEVRSGENILIIDAGTGVRNLGLALQREFEGVPLSLDFLLTHFHWDHIQGLPFFAPLYGPSNEFTFYAAGRPERIHEILVGQMSSPYFPVGFGFLKAKLEFAEVQMNAFRRGPFTVHPFPMNHPNGAYGYRIEKDGSTFVHASDLEPGDAEMDRVLREYAQNADVLVIDAQYTPEEYQTKRGWGHCTWLEAAGIARECKVDQLVLFHHDPGHDDGAMDRIVEQARTHFDNTVAARENCEIYV